MLMNHTDEIILTANVDENGCITERKLNIDTSSVYNLRFDYKGNEFLAPSTTYETITILKIPTTTTATPQSSIYNMTNIEISIKDDLLDETVLNAPITITLPVGSKINTNIGRTGSIKIPLTIATGIYNITAEYTGSDLLNISNKTIELN